MHSDEMESDDSDTYSEGDDDYVLDDSELNGWADAVDSPAPVRKTAVIVEGGDDDDDLMADDDDVCGTLFGRCACPNAPFRWCPAGASAVGAREDGAQRQP